MSKKDKSDIIYIYKDKKDLDSYERLMLKYFPHKYKIAKKKKQKKDKLPKEVREYIKEQKFWDEVAKYEKNPKKYKNKMNKREKILSKYFKEDNYRNKLSKKKNSEDINKSMILFLENITYEKDKEKMFGSIYGNSRHYNKTLMESLGDINFGTTVNMEDKNEMSMLKALEDELISELNSDLFEDNLIVQYYDGNKKKLKKRLKTKGPKKKYDEEYISNILDDDEDEDMLEIY